MTTQEITLEIGEPYAAIHESAVEELGEAVVAQQYEDFIHQLNQKARQQ